MTWNILNGFVGAFAHNDCQHEGLEGRFDLAFVVAKRAKAISSGSKVLVDNVEDPANHPVLAAIEELRQGKISFDDIVSSLSGVSVTSKSIPHTQSASGADSYLSDGDDGADYDSESSADELTSSSYGVPSSGVDIDEES